MKTVAREPRNGPARAKLAGILSVPTPHMQQKRLKEIFASSNDGGSWVGSSELIAKWKQIEPWHGYEDSESGCAKLGSLGLLPCPCCMQHGRGNLDRRGGLVWLDAVQIDGEVEKGDVQRRPRREMGAVKACARQPWLLDTDPVLNVERTQGGSDNERVEATADRLVWSHTNMDSRNIRVKAVFLKQILLEISV
uniref:Uncharacterized protein n=1 Tax=Hyaloperonospora arabidopsidis (strain Emoy2) TaxID=559515 RepID=M4C1T5_HYAAE